MQLNIRLTGTAVLAIAAVTTAAWYWHPRTADVPPTKADPPPPIGRPEVIETNGGQLTVAIVNATEELRKTDPKAVWGIPLGTTKSTVQAVATYRYYIDMERRWPVDIDGKTAVVRAPQIKTQLPVAFDSALLERKTENGWARFNKAENLTALERSVTEQLQGRADSPQYEQMKRDAARVTVQAFVSTWLLRERGWGKPPEYRIVVLFPGETLLSQLKPSRAD